MTDAERPSQASKAETSSPGSPPEAGGRATPGSVPLASTQRGRWRALLAGRSPRAVLSRIVPGDPLGVFGLVSNRLRERALLLDADLVRLRTFARIARSAPHYRGRPDLTAWLDARIDDAVKDLLREGARSTEPHAELEPSGAWTTLARPLELEPRAALVACLNFDELPYEERRAFFELVLHRRDLDEWATEEDESPTELARRARRALNTLLQNYFPPATWRSRSTSAPEAP